MNRYIHGGDVTDILLDFSVNTNPYGIHPDIRRAMEQALFLSDKYPEYGAISLTNRLAEIHRLASKQVLVTAGASEAFIGICRGLGVKKGAVVDPGFYGYEHALESIGAEIIRYSFDDILSDGLQFEADLQVLFLCNPNNPDGRVLPTERIEQIINQARTQGIYIVLDECFLPLSEAWKDSFIDRLSSYNNLIVVRAFTKTFALAGVRLGYLVCQDEGLIEHIRATLPEWNVSGIAIAAGLEALNHLDYLEESRKLISVERARMEKELTGLGLKPADSSANFILFQGPDNLKEALLKEKILIRDCCNYHCLPKNSYRIAVLTPEKNDCLLQALRKLAK